MERTYSKGASISYVDPKGERHAALVTQWWGLSADGKKDPAYGTDEIGCNLVYVSSDATKRDPYGDQLERSTSVVHKSRQPAGGNFWCWPEE